MRTRPWWYTIQASPRAYIPTNTQAQHRPRTKATGYDRCKVGQRAPSTLRQPPKGGFVNVARGFIRRASPTASLRAKCTSLDAQHTAAMLLPGTNGLVPTPCLPNQSPVDLLNPGPYTLC